MAELDDSYDGLPGFARLASVAKDFDFGRALPRATFPAEFVKTYSLIANGDPVDWDNSRIHFLARFIDHTEIAMYDGLFSPQTMQSQNAIIAESIYADPGAVIMPPGFYAIGSAYGKADEMRLMVNLDGTSADYGKIFVWHLAHDALGTGDNTRGLGFVADNLHSFFANLQTEDKL